MRIDTQTQRQRLHSRREPYWHRLAKGQAIGFRRTDNGGNWIARLTTGTAKKYHALGPGPSFDRPEKDQGQVLTYDDAFKEALKWFAGTEGGADPHYRLRDAIADYVAHLKVANSHTAAHSVELRLRRHVPEDLLKTKVAKLTTNALKSWHQGLVVLSDDAESVRKSKDNANRMLSILKAALNLAFREGTTASDGAWKRVRPFKGVSESRKLFLTDEQVGQLLEHTTGGFHDLCKAAVLAGARYGELAAARVRDLDARHGTLHLSGKTGSRHVYLSKAALDFLQDVARDRLPDAWLFVKDDGEPWGKSHQHRLMKAAVRAAKLPRETVFYSLRHYHISKALIAGVPMQMVAENCGTSVPMITRHYGKFLEQDRKAMFDRVELGHG